MHLESEKESKYLRTIPFAMLGGGPLVSLSSTKKVLKWEPTLEKQASRAQDEDVKSGSPDINQAKVPLPEKPSPRSPWGNVLHTSQTPFSAQITHYTYGARWNLEKVLQCNQASKLKWILQTALRLTTFPNHFWHISWVSSIHFASSRWLKRLCECVYFFLM